MQAFANNRTKGIEVLFGSETDRFWLLVNPADPNEAVLLPGFSTKKEWGRYSEVSRNNPLLHHFDLRPGDGLRIHRAALLRQDKGGGDWVLAQKGEVSGVS